MLSHGNNVLLALTAVSTVTTAAAIQHEARQLLSLSNLMKGRQACRPDFNQCGSGATCGYGDVLGTNFCVCENGYRGRLDLSQRVSLGRPDEYVVIVPMGISCGQSCDYSYCTECYGTDLDDLFDPSHSFPPDEIDPPQTAESFSVVEFAQSFSSLPSDSPVSSEPPLTSESFSFVEFVQSFSSLSFDVPTSSEEPFMTSESFSIVEFAQSFSSSMPSETPSPSEPIFSSEAPVSESFSVVEFVQSFSSLPSDTPAPSEPIPTSEPPFSILASASSSLEPPVSAEIFVVSEPLSSSELAPSSEPISSSEEPFFLFGFSESLDPATSSGEITPSPTEPTILASFFTESEEVPSSFTEPVILALTESEELSSDLIEPTVSASIITESEEVPSSFTEPIVLALTESEELSSDLIEPTVSASLFSGSEEVPSSFTEPIVLALTESEDVPSSSVPAPTSSVVVSSELSAEPSSSSEDPIVRFGSSEPLESVTATEDVPASPTEPSILASFFTESESSLPPGLSETPTEPVALVISPSSASSDGESTPDSTPSPVPSTSTLRSETDSLIILLQSVTSTRTITVPGDSTATPVLSLEVCDGDCEEEPPVKPSGAVILNLEDCDGDCDEPPPKPSGTVILSVENCDGDCHESQSDEPPALFVPGEIDPDHDCPTCSKPNGESDSHVPPHDAPSYDCTECSEEERLFLKKYPPVIVPEEDSEAPCPGCAVSEKVHTHDETHHHDHDGEPCEHCAGFADGKTDGPDHHVEHNDEPEKPCPTCTGSTSHDKIVSHHEGDHSSPDEPCPTCTGAEHHQHHHETGPHHASHGHGADKPHHARPGHGSPTGVAMPDQHDDSRYSEDEIDADINTLVVSRLGNVEDHGEGSGDHEQVHDGSLPRPTPHVDGATVPTNDGDVGTSHDDVVDHAGEHAGHGGHGDSTNDSKGGSLETGEDEYGEEEPYITSGASTMTATLYAVSAVVFLQFVAGMGKFWAS